MPLLVPFHAWSQPRLPSAPVDVRSGLRLAGDVSSQICIGVRRAAAGVDGGSRETATWGGAPVAALRTGLPGPGKGNPARAALSTVWRETSPAERAALIGVLLLLIPAAPVLMLVTLLLAALAAVAVRLGRRRLAAA